MTDKTTNHFAITDTAKSPTGTPLSGLDDTGGRSFDYGVSSNARKADPLTDGGVYCMTCHDRSSMIGKDDCWACHRHGDGGRW